MNRTDIEERDGNIIVTFQLPRVQEKDLILIFEKESVRVIANSTNAAFTVSDGKNLDIKYDTVYFDKTAILEGADFSDLSKIQSTYFAGFLEVVIPKK